MTQIFTWENVLQLICEKEDDEGPPEIMFPGCYSGKEFGLYDDDNENDDEPW